MSFDASDERDSGDRLDAVCEVLKRLIDLLSRFGQGDKADWLAERLAKLPGGSAENGAAVLAELHGAVLGMGGLMDLQLQGGSLEESDGANAELDRLGDQLFELTR